MNILIVSTNRSKNPVAVMPFGACIVSAACEKSEHKTRLLDLMFSKNPTNSLKKELNKMPPDVVGLSIRNIDNNNIKNPAVYFEEIKSLVNLIKKNSKAVIVLGGAAVGIMPEEFLRYTGVSIAVTGFGEIVFPELLDAISKKSSLNIPGVAGIENNTFSNNSLPDVSTVDTCVSPDFYRWIDVKSYRKKLSSIPVQTKRGCPYRCIYCTYPKIEGSQYRLFSPESVADTVKNLVEKGFNDIEFVDNVFNSPYEHAIDVCRKIESEKIDARFQTMSLNPRFLDDNILGAMENAGFSGIGVTAESASDKVLRNLGKEYTSIELQRASLSVQKHKIPCFWMFMLGGPGETKETVAETLDFAKNFIRTTDVAFFNIGIRIYPGTELEKIAKDEGIIKKSGNELLNPAFYISPGLNLDRTISTVKKNMAENFNFIDSDSMGLNILPSIYELGYRFGFKPPLWKYVPSARHIFRFAGVNI
ncbi:MAG: radical SAM protein [Elusimicrobiota bacterium]|nr:radical SAM protein [Elusimicrobiota bacterium]